MGSASGAHIALKWHSKPIDWPKRPRLFPLRFSHCLSRSLCLPAFRPLASLVLFHASNNPFFPTCPSMCTASPNIAYITNNCQKRFMVLRPILSNHFARDRIRIQTKTAMLKALCMGTCGKLYRIDLSKRCHNTTTRALRVQVVLKFSIQFWDTWELGRRIGLGFGGKILDDLF